MIDLTRCRLLTDESLMALSRSSCARQLRAISISECVLMGNAALRALIEHAGGSLQTLKLNGLYKVRFCLLIVTHAHMRTTGLHTCVLYAFLSPIIQKKYFHTHTHARTQAHPQARAQALTHVRTRTYAHTYTHG